MLLVETEVVMLPAVSAPVEAGVTLREACGLSTEMVITEFTSRFMSAWAEFWAAEESLGMRVREPIVRARVKQDRNTRVLLNSLNTLRYLGVLLNNWGLNFIIYLCLSSYLLWLYSTLLFYTIQDFFGQWVGANVLSVFRCVL